MRPQAGLLNVYKPEGWTSYDVCSYLKPLLRASKVGHTGTLDPFAQGVLLVCFGRATKLFPYLQGEKEYRALLKLGAKTDTGDLTGKVIAEAPVGDLEEERVREVIGDFMGRIWQRPPQFSALKRDGKKLYELARRGEGVELAPRRVTIKRIDLRDFSSPYMEIEVVCSSGTYIRSLASDIGERLGTHAHLTKLVRTRIENFRVEESLSPSRISELVQEGRWEDFVIPMEDALPDFKEVRVRNSSRERVRVGLPLREREILSLPQRVKKGERIKLLDEGGNLLALLLATADIDEKGGFEASYLRVLC